MHRVTNYFRGEAPQGDPQDVDSAPALGIPSNEALSSEDEELIQACEYLRSVRAESRQLPFAVVANIPSVAPQILDDSFPEDELSDDISGVPRVMTDAVVEYFISLRLLLKRDEAGKTDTIIDFGDGMEEILATADSFSITRGVEDLSLLLDELESERVVEWLFGLLVYLDEPLLEDTAASLQVLRRYCEKQIHNSEPTRAHKFQVCRIIIRHYFNQR